MQPICRSYSSSIAVFSITIFCRNYIQVAINNTICWWYLLNRVKNWPQDCVKFTIFMTVKKEMRSRYYSFYNLFWSAAYLQPVCHNFYSHWLHAIRDCRKYSKSAGDKITQSMIALITIKIFVVLMKVPFLCFFPGTSGGKYRICIPYCLQNCHTVRLFSQKNQIILYLMFILLQL